MNFCEARTQDPSSAAAAKNKLMVNRSAEPQSLLEVWQLYALETQATHSEPQAYAKLTQVKTALIRYTLPCWGLPSLQGRKVTEAETAQAFDLMARISTEQLQSALLAQQQVFEQQQVPDKIRRTYRSALKQLLTWCQQQAWSWATTDAEPQLLLPPKRHKRSAQALHTRKPYDHAKEPLRQEYRYGLGSVKGDVMNEPLQAELEAFVQWRQNSSRLGLNAVQASTVARELAGIRLILGWLHRVQGVRSEALSLTRIIPLVPLPAVSDPAAAAQAKAAARASIDLAYRYIHWLRAKPEEGGRGLTTQQVELSNLKLFKSVACFLYDREMPPEHSAQPWRWLEQSPVIQAFSREIAQWRRRSTHKVSGQRDETSHVKIIATWPEVLAFVEALRAECVPRLSIEQQTRKQALSFGPLRALPAIAQSYQRFLLCALMSYLPPQRQQAYRDLLVEPKPSLKLDAFSGYLYTENDLWYLATCDRKGGRTRGQEFQLEIPNIQYPHGRYFYQYLQAWLYEYTYVDAKGQEHRTNGLRAALQPHHAYLFTKKNGKKYENPTDLSRLVRDAAFKLTGSTINPHRFRYLFVNYWVERQPKPATLEVLAACMGHSPQMSIEVYEKALTQPETAQVISREVARLAQALVDQTH